MPFKLCHIMFVYLIFLFKFGIKNFLVFFFSFQYFFSYPFLSDHDSHYNQCIFMYVHIIWLSPYQMYHRFHLATHLCVFAVFLSTFLLKNPSIKWMLSFSLVVTCYKGFTFSYWQTIKDYIQSNRFLLSFINPDMRHYKFNLEALAFWFF